MSFRRLSVFVTALLLLGVWIFHKQFTQAEETEPVVVATSTVEVVAPRVKPEKQVVKGIYLTASSAQNSKLVDQIIKLIDTTELNAVVIDIKDYTGNILYKSQVQLVQELKTARPVMKDVPAIIKKFHDHHIYVIARQTVFQDPVLAAAKPEWAIKVKDGSIWRDKLGLSWVDPTHQGVWDYNIAIAKEAIGLSFDEINFDYVRFPSDGDLRNVVYAIHDKKKYEVMRDFYAYLSNALQDEPAWISVDFFGFVMERHDGMSIGQRLEDAVGVVDYISPMMYPSHYPKGYLNFENPADHPKEVIAHGLKMGIPYFKDQRALVRPWLQAFHLGAYYDASKMRAQIDAVEKQPNGGWLLWNASNRYTSAGLKVDPDLRRDGSSS